LLDSGASSHLVVTPDNWQGPRTFVLGNCKKQQHQEEEEEEEEEARRRKSRTMKTSSTGALSACGSKNDFMLTGLKAEDHCTHVV
jgi:hypothetical protein